jgi:hypothetical protein
MDDSRAAVRLREQIVGFSGVDLPRFRRHDQVVT